MGDTSQYIFETKAINCVTKKDALLKLKHTYSCQKNPPPPQKTTVFDLFKLEWDVGCIWLSFRFATFISHKGLSYGPNKITDIVPSISLKGSVVVPFCFVFALTRGS